MNSLVEDKKKYLLCITLFIALIGITFYYLFKGNDINNILFILKKADYKYIIIGLFLMFMFIFCEAINLKILFNSLNQKSGFLQCLKYAFIGFYFSSITPSSSGGQPVQMYYMNKDKIDISISSLSLLIITVFFQVGTLIIGLFLFIIRHNLIIKNISNIKLLIAYGSSVYLILITFFIIVIFTKNVSKVLVDFLIFFLAKFKIIKNVDKITKKIYEHLNEYHRGSEFIKDNPVILIKVFFVTIIQLLSMLSITFCVYKAFGLSKFNFFDIISIQSMLSISVNNIPLPGAIGASENIFLKIYETMFNKNIIMPAMLLTRGINYYSFLIISCVISMYAYFLTLRKKELKL